MYYEKTVKKYGLYCEGLSKTGIDSVLPCFLEDIKQCKPDYIRETKTMLYVFFKGKYSVLYSLPIHCKQYLQKEGLYYDN